MLDLVLTLESSRYVCNYNGSSNVAKIYRIIMCSSSNMCLNKIKFLPIHTSIPKRPLLLGLPFSFLGRTPIVRPVVESVGHRHIMAQIHNF